MMREKRNQNRQLHVTQEELAQAIVVAASIASRWERSGVSSQRGRGAIEILVQRRGIAPAVRLLS